MMPLAYSTPPPQSPDWAHLRTLSICHYVWGGLTMLFASMFIIHIILGAVIASGAFPITPAKFPTTVQTGSGVVVINSSVNAGPPTWMGVIFIGVGTTLVLLGWTAGILTIVSGRAIAQHRRRIFSLVMAGINCASFPLGTLLGVFTFIVLLRPSVKAMYESYPQQV